MTDVVGILLAAGYAKRFGSAKLMHPLPHGEPVAKSSANALLSVLPRTVAVVRPDDYALIELFTELDLQIVTNPQAEKGMGTSLAAGIEATANADGWLIALADMPWVQSDTIHALVTRIENGASIVAPEYAGRRGNPVGFSSHWLKPLQALSADIGARDLIADHLDQLELVATEDAGVLKDIDYPDDLSS
jgi:molybdenum cofactor cytidylyltransferase